MDTSNLQSDLQNYREYASLLLRDNQISDCIPKLQGRLRPAIFILTGLMRNCEDLNSAYQISNLIDEHTPNYPTFWKRLLFIQEREMYVRLKHVAKIETCMRKLKNLLPQITLNPQCEGSF